MSREQMMLAPCIIWPLRQRGENMIPSQAFRGFRLTAASAALIAAFAISIVCFGGASEASVRTALRLTARTSLLFFVLAFTAASAALLWPNMYTRWQRENRHDLAWCFATSHAWHALAIVALAYAYPVAFAEHTRATPLAPGIVTYALIGVFAVSSSRASGASEHRRVWAVMNSLSAFVVWAGFFKAVVSRIGQDVVYVLAAGLLLTALLVRLAAAKRLRSLRHAHEREERLTSEPLR